MFYNNGFIQNVNKFALIHIAVQKLIISKSVIFELLQ